MCVYLHISINEKTKSMENLNDILDSKEFNEMFNVEQELKELENDGWTLEEARKFAQFLIKTSK